MYLSAAKYTGTNEAPTANAGEDQNVYTLIAATLDASASTDPDGDSLLYFWEQIDGPAVELDDPYAEQPSFIPEEVAGYTFKLEVTDGEYTSEDEVVVVSEENPNPPVDDDTVDDDVDDDDDDDDADDDVDADDDDDDDDDDGCGC